MAASESQRLMLKVCYQAYRRHLSHKEIAANLGISRFQVARLLRAALDAGYVSVNILEPERWHSDWRSSSRSEPASRRSSSSTARTSASPSCGHGSPTPRAGS